jgi:hypothetical protein
LRMSFVAMVCGRPAHRRRGAKPDANHGTVRDGLKDVPRMTVLDTTQTGGPLDLMAYYEPKQRFRFLEVKDGSKPESARKLTKKEAKFIKRFPDMCAVVLSLDDALRAMGVT